MSDPTIPLVPEEGYTQPEVPALEETPWPDFGWDDPPSSSLLGASEPTVAQNNRTEQFGTRAPAPAPNPGEAAAPSYGPPAATTPLPYQNPQPPYQNPQPGVTYQQPNPYQQEPTRTPAQSWPAPEPPIYETYRPYQPAAPVAPAQISYPLVVAQAPQHPNAVASLVLGIGGLIGIPILAPVAWYLAARGRREMAQYPGRWTTGVLNAGYVLGIIGTVLLALVLVLAMILVTLGIAAFSR